VARDQALIDREAAATERAETERRQ
jgi:hypothetical protein